MNKLEKDKKQVENYVDRSCVRRDISYSQPEQLSFTILEGDNVSISAIERELAFAKKIGLDSLYCKKTENGGSNFITLSSKFVVQETDEGIKNRLIKQKEFLISTISDYLHQVDVWTYELELLEGKIKLDKYDI